ncbi:MAG: cytochrome c-type biogenesis CcmF C-terminal domain-containing protein [Archangium sp.]|nr:cytochrome c-type biogenesis CcmF C-terminal domain-containing protein [Archangium sp.]
MNLSNLGYGLILLGLLCAAFAAIVGITTGMMRKESALPLVQKAIYGFAASMLAANLVMVYGLLTHDFSVKYVAQVGSRSTPTIFTIVSLWSALEGSILFWGAIMGAYIFAFAWTYRKEHGRYMQLSLGVMAAVATFFAFLIAGPANPWTHIPNPLSDGPGPNPLLQNHPLMIIHPPMLYLGYVGMTIPFGIAAGALLRGELGDAWLVPLRKWTLVPWIFLSIGIILGSWWAYAVLGWGGYWAWDPVENASFMPWLTATAFMHSTMVLEKKKSLKLWTIALALASFILTIVGTFMTRSGVFNSVHSFTQSDIGPTFLVFIGVLLVFSVLLLAVRGHMLVAESQLGSIASREGSILLNNLVFAAITFVVLLGTLYPLITEGLLNKKITVGEPYFNQMALPLSIATLFLMGVGPMLPWGQADPKVVQRQAIIPGAIGLLVAGACMLAGYRGWMPLTVFGLAGFVTVVTLRELFLPAQQRMTEQKEALFTAVFVSATRARRRFGGYIVHLGIVAIMVAVAASSAYKVHNTGSLKLGESMKIGDYSVRFDGLDKGKEPHREWISANLTVIEPGGREIKSHGTAAPRMNFYERSNDPVGSPSVTEMVLRDVYVSLLSYDAQANTASFNMWVFPLVGWIWYAIPLLVLGTLIALWPQRKQKPEPAAAPAADAVPGAAP